MLWIMCLYCICSAVCLTLLGSQLKCWALSCHTGCKIISKQHFILLEYTYLIILRATHALMTEPWFYKPINLHIHTAANLLPAVLSAFGSSIFVAFVLDYVFSSLVFVFIYIWSYASNTTPFSQCANVIVKILVNLLSWKPPSCEGLVWLLLLGLVKPDSRKMSRVCWTCFKVQLTLVDVRRMGEAKLNKQCSLMTLIYRHEVIQEWDGKILRQSFEKFSQ